MRKTMRNIEKVVGKKERVARYLLDYCKQYYGKESVQYQKALSEWAALSSVKMLFESDVFFDTEWEMWVNDKAR